MPVSPIEYRYGRNEVKNIFSEESRFRYMLDAEEALSYSEWKNGIIPKEAYEDISRVVSGKIVKLDRVKEIEAETRHDLMSVVRALTERCGPGAPYVHYGITSSDIVDTATALQLKDFYRILLNDLFDLQKVFENLVHKHSRTIMVGRTHGQHASPITFGLKMAVYLNETGRHAERVVESRKRVLVGKMLGPVGTGASIGERALQVQKDAMDKLGLGIEDGATQVVDRDRYVEYLQVISNIATSLEKFTTEVRNLQRTEIDEVSEFFDISRQVGSSAMPSKRNPIDSENVGSLARIIRSMVYPEYEAAITWHERDLTNSALERFTIPYASILIDHILTKSVSIFSRLIVNVERMKTTAESNELSMSENAVKLLVSVGIPRQDAHEIVRKSAMEAISGRRKMSDVILEKTDKITAEELQDAMDPSNFIGVSQEICKISIEKSRQIRDFLGGK
jgi:adenylosuccinate lyase